MAAYSMGKAAINHFTLILAAELGKRGITVNAIGPGLTVTDFTAHARQDPNVVQQVSAHTALGRLGEAEDIAGVAAWLASDDARWVTGQYIEASGGIGIGMIGKWIHDFRRLADPGGSRGLAGGEPRPAAGPTARRRSYAGC